MLSFGGTFGFGRKSVCTFGLLSVSAESQKWTFGRPLFKCFKFRNKSLLLKAYTAYILPLFDYCSTIWSPSKLCDIDLLEDVQRNFTKRLQGMDELSYEERLEKCGLVSLELKSLRKDLSRYLLPDYQWFNSVKF